MKELDIEVSCPELMGERTLYYYTNGECSLQSVRRGLRSIVKSVELTCLMYSRGKPASTYIFLEESEKNPQYFLELLDMPHIRGSGGDWEMQVKEGDRVLYRKKFRVDISLSKKCYVVRNFDEEQEAGIIYSLGGYDES